MVIGPSWMAANSFCFWHLPLGLSSVFPFDSGPFAWLFFVYTIHFFGPASSGFIVSTGKYKYRIVRLPPFAVHGSHQFRLFATACHVQYSPPVNNSRQCCGVLVRGRQGPYTLHHFNFDGPTYLLLLALMLC